MPETCPSRERWQDHLIGSLPVDEEAMLTEHLDRCAACRETLETLASGGDSLLALARQAGAATDASSPALREVVGRFQASSEQTQAETTAAKNDVLAYLSPSEKPGSLGRIGHYEVQAIIGKGGFGSVLKAFDEKLHRIVAIKVLSPAYAAIGSARKRFVREARAAAAVSHDHVVGIYAVEEDQNPPYLVMQCVDGQSLQEKLDEKGPLSLREILRIGLQTAEGLAAAHKQGLVHRDIKPANILLENGVERVKITDFGLARAVDDASVTQSGTVAGTPMYMSPEQAEGLPIDHRSDLFSLGTVLYAMCTGHSPFRASGTHAVLKRVIDASPRPIREINDEIPEWLCDLISRLHARKPEDRFQRAQEVANLLGQHLADVQTGRAGRVTDRRVAPMTVTGAPAPVADAPGSPTAAEPRRGRKLVLGLLGGLVGAGLIVGAFVAFMTKWTQGVPPIDANDVLKRMVGTWSVDIERALPKASPSHGKVRFEWVADGKVLKGYFVNDTGQESLTVYGFDAQSGTFRRWFFASDAAPTSMQGPHEGQWDAKTAVLASHGELPLFHKLRHEDRWIDADNFEIRTVVSDPQGQEVARQTKRMHRLATNEVVGPKLPPDPKRPAELARMDDAIGSWTTNAVVTLAELGDQKVTSQSTTTGVAILGGRFIESEERNESMDRKDYVLVGYDESRKTYRFWQFGSGGDFSEADGVRHESENKIDWKSLDGRLTGRWTMRSPDERHIQFAVKDRRGRRLYEVDAVARRRDAAAPGWVQLFNGRDLTGWKPFPVDKEVWRVEDGILIGQGAACAMLPSERKDYRDFHLRVEAMINEGGNSGVWLRTDLKSQDGYEANINHSHRDPARTGSFGVKVAGKQKWLHDQKSSPAPANTWFTLEVIAAGPSFTVKIDGVTIAQVTDTNRSLGHVGLELFEHASVVRIRKIEIKELPPT